MVKTWIEVCLISGRGLRRTSSSLWKLQWFAVGWIRPDNKYCTKIDASGNSNPVWKTAFSTSLDFDPSQPNFQDLALHVEVYSRDPIFLKESLLGSATILLKEFLDKYYASNSDSDVDVRKPVDEVGSFQLRKRNSNKPLGFVDVSIRISEEREDPSSSYLGGEDGFNLDNLGGTTKGKDHGQHFPLGKPHQPYTIPPNYPVPRTPPPPPPPPSNVGYTPNFFPTTSNYTPSSSSYINMPSAAPRGFGIGLGTGALAAGAVIFGDNFMTGFDVPAAATLSTYPPF